MSLLTRRLSSEFIATALLLAIVVGSGIMAEQLAGGNIAIALLANTFATVFGLFVLIETFGSVSAHMNPAVSAVMAWRGELRFAQLPAYVLVQLAGAVVGVVLAHAMFSLPLTQVAGTARFGAGIWLAETVATAGLILVVLRAPNTRIAAVVAAWIGAAYWFTASTAFANPAVTLARSLTDTFTGITAASLPGFLLAQALGALLGVFADRLLGSTRDS